MLRSFLLLCIFWIYLSASLQEPNNEKTTYTAAMVQYNPLLGFNKTVENLRNLKLILEKAKKLDVDIVILPEYGFLHPDSRFATNDKLRVPSLRAVGYNNMTKSYRSDKGKFVQQEARKVFAKHAVKVTCDGSSCKLWCNLTDITNDSLTHMVTCIHNKDNLNLYIVFHSYEIENCNATVSNCPSDQMFLYSTAFALDRSGTVVARHRKPNVFDEPWLDSGNDNSDVLPSHFTTDFNVTFQLIIGTELLGSKSAGKNVILTTGRHDDAPLFLSVQDQVNLAVGSDVSLLAAGFSKDGTGGIYMGKDEPIYKMISNESSNHFIYANVTKPSYRKPQEPIRNYTTKFISKRDSKISKKSSNFTKPVSHGFNMENFAQEERNVSINLNDEPHQTYHLSITELDCNFEVQLRRNGSSSFVMKAVAIRGMYELIDGTLIGVELCAILACENNQLKSCAQLPDYTTDSDFPYIFESIVISRRLNMESSKNFVSATAITSTGLMINHRDYNLIQSKPSKDSLLFLHLTRPSKNIVTFGIVTQVYNIDENLGTENSLFNCKLCWSAAALQFFVINFMGVLILIWIRLPETERERKRTNILLKRVEGTHTIQVKLLEGKVFVRNEIFRELIHAIDNGDNERAEAIMNDPDNYVDASWDYVEGDTEEMTLLRRMSYVFSRPEKEFRSRYFPEGKMKKENMREILAENQRKNEMTELYNRYFLTKISIQMYVKYKAECEAYSAADAAESAINDHQNTETDPSGRLSTETDPSRRQYAGTDPSGRLSTETDPSGCQYAGTDPSGRLSTETYPSRRQYAGTGFSGRLSTETYLSRRQYAGTGFSGRLSTETDPSGLQYAGTDPSGRLSTETDPSGRQYSGFTSVAETYSLSHNNEDQNLDTPDSITQNPIDSTDGQSKYNMVIDDGNGQYRRMSASGSEHPRPMPIELNITDSHDRPFTHSRVDTYIDEDVD